MRYSVSYSSVQIFLFLLWSDCCRRCWLQLVVVVVGVASQHNRWRNCKNEREQWLELVIGEMFIETRSTDRVSRSLFRVIHEMSRVFLCFYIARRAMHSNRGVKQRFGVVCYWLGCHCTNWLTTDDSLVNWNSSEFLPFWSVNRETTNLARKPHWFELCQWQNIYLIWFSSCADGVVALMAAVCCYGWCWRPTHTDGAEHFTAAVAYYKWFGFATDFSTLTLDDLAEITK